MANDNIECVRLDQVALAAELGLAPLGAEFAGFVVLEATARLRDAGGGDVRPEDLSLDTTGQVALLRSSQRGPEATATQSEIRSVASLRALLRGLLEVTTSISPSLRACARRREQTSFVTLTRELTGALIPLNRAANRRGVARIARATLDALANGMLQARAVASPRQNERDSVEEQPASAEVSMDIDVDELLREPSAEHSLPAPSVQAKADPSDGPTATARRVVDTLSPPPLPVFATRVVAVDANTVRGAASPSSLAELSEIDPFAPERMQVESEPTPVYTPAYWLYPKGAPPLTAEALEAELSLSDIEDGWGDGIEIVSHLPPIVTQAPPAAAMSQPSVDRSVAHPFSAVRERESALIGRQETATRLVSL